MITDARPAPEDEVTVKRWHRWIKPGALALAAFVVLLSPFWAPLILGRMDFFRVRHVEVRGARYLDPADILSRMRVDTLRSVWDGTREMRDRIAGHPLVRDVAIDRRLPGTLVVSVVEHAPVALVPTVNGFLAYDERGVVLPIDPTAREVDVPIVSNPDSAVLRLLGAARSGAPGLYRRISEVRKDGRELVLVLDSLPVRALIDVTLQRLADLELVERDVARRRLRPAEFDLRYRDQVIARLP